jgi:hypothetical protein
MGIPFLGSSKGTDTRMAAPGTIGHVSLASSQTMIAAKPVWEREGSAKYFENSKT